MVEVYTDGSCNQRYQLGTWAAIVLSGQSKIILDGIETDTTHQRMELTAVIKALEYIFSATHLTAPIIIYTDSQYIVKLPEREAKLKQSGYITKKNHVLPNTDLIQKIFQYRESFSVNFIKVKAHEKSNGIENLNREADKHCRKILRKHLEK
jgi:ribonuclease HI